MVDLTGLVYLTLKVEQISSTHHGYSRKLKKMFYIFLNGVADVTGAISPDGQDGFKLADSSSHSSHVGMHLISTINAL